MILSEATEADMKKELLLKTKTCTTRRIKYLAQWPLFHQNTYDIRNLKFNYNAESKL